MPPFRPAAHLRPTAPAFLPNTAPESSRKRRVSALTPHGLAVDSLSTTVQGALPTTAFTAALACRPPATSPQRRLPGGAPSYPAMTHLTLHAQAHNIARATRFLAQPSNIECRSLVEDIVTLLQYRGDADTTAVLHAARHMVLESYGFDEAEAALSTASRIASGCDTRFIKLFDDLISPDADNKTRLRVGQIICDFPWPRQDELTGVAANLCRLADHRPPAEQLAMLIVGLSEVPGGASQIADRVGNEFVDTHTAKGLLRAMLQQKPATWPSLLDTMLFAAESGFVAIHTDDA
jgi:hypothetical protein